MVNSANTVIKQFLTGVNQSNNNSGNVYNFEDPTYIGFKVMFNFNEDNSSPLFNEGAGSSASAINYLNNVNRQTESKLLTRFKNVLRTLNTTYEYMFQSVSGLSPINSWVPGQNLRTKDIVLTFDCLESVDQKMNYMMQLYLKSMYDWKYMRKLLPYNLQFFTMTLMIYEIRNFNSVVAAAQLENVNQNINSSFQPKAPITPTSPQPAQTASNLLRNNLPTQVYVFDYCTFDFNDSSKFLDTVSNADVDKEISFSFKVNVGRVREQLSFPLFGTIIEPLIINSTQGYSASGNTTVGSGRLSDANTEALKPLYNNTGKDSPASLINSSSTGKSTSEEELSRKSKAINRMKSEYASNKDIIESQSSNLSNAAAQLPRQLGNQIVDNTFSKVKSLSLGNVYDFRHQPITSTLQGLIGQEGLGNVYGATNNINKNIPKNPII